MTDLGPDRILNTDDTEASQPSHDLVLFFPVGFRSQLKFVGTSSTYPPTNNAHCRLCYVQNKTVE